MADDIDRANDKAMAMQESAESEVRYQAQHTPVGEPGDCDLCGEWSGRLVDGACASCRDLYRLP